MLKLEARPEQSKLMSVMSPLLALAITVVIAKGRVSPSVATSAATTLMIGEWMSGLWDQNAHEEAAHAQA